MGAAVCSVCSLCSLSCGAESAIARRGTIEDAPIHYSFSTLPPGIVLAGTTMVELRASREPKTIARLKQSMDRRFQSMDRAMDRRFARFDRKKADKSDVRRLERKVDRGFREIRQEIKDTAEETRRHLDAVVESLSDDLTAASRLSLPTAATVPRAARSRVQRSRAVRAGSARRLPAPRR